METLRTIICLDCILVSICCSNSNFPIMLDLHKKKTGQQMYRRLHALCSMKFCFFGIWMLFKNVLVKFEDSIVHFPYMQTLLLSSSPHCGFGSLIFKCRSHLYMVVLWNFFLWWKVQRTQLTMPWIGCWQIIRYICAINALRYDNLAANSCLWLYEGMERVFLWDQ